jgi:hypothetical protein
MFSLLNRGKQMTRVYRCKECGGWHVTRQRA